LPTKALFAAQQTEFKQEQQQAVTNKAAKQLLWTNKVLPALVLAACCWLATLVADKGLASAYYFKANYYLDLWQRKPATLEQHNWQEAADAIARAVKYHSDHPHYLLTQAKINEWGWYKGFQTAEQIAINDQLYQQAIALRPSWPNAYADYAYFLGIVNFRVSDALAQLDKAWLYGPYTTEVFHRTLLISASRWALLNGPQKAQSFKALEQMVKNSYGSYKQALQISRGYKLQRPFCIYLQLKQAEFKPETNKLIAKDFCDNSPSS
jgi:hypothetical protein